jgi:hypothetical protein
VLACESRVYTDSAFYPVIGQMERAAGLTHDDMPRAKLDKLDAVLAETSTSIEDASLFADTRTMDAIPHSNSRHSSVGRERSMRSFARLRR